MNARRTRRSIGLAGDGLLAICLGGMRLLASLVEDVRKTVFVLAAASLTILTLIAVLAWNLLAPTSPYPGATRTHLRWPSSFIDVRGSCIQWTTVSKTYYTAPQDQAHVIGWLKQAGWMGNFRYDDSVLKQTSRQYGLLYVAWVNEIFVESRAAGANLVSTKQMTLSVGRC